MFTPLSFSFLRGWFLFVHSKGMSICTAWIRTHDSMVTAQPIMGYSDTWSTHPCIATWCSWPTSTISIAQNYVNWLGMWLPLAQEVLSSIPKLGHWCCLLPLVKELSGFGCCCWGSGCWCWCTWLPVSWLSTFPSTTSTFFACSLHFLFCKIKYIQSSLCFRKEFQSV